MNLTVFDFLYSSGTYEKSKSAVFEKCEMRASLTLLVSKKAGSQTEPLRPLLDKMSTNSGAVLQ